MKKHPYVWTVVMGALLALLGACSLLPATQEAVDTENATQAILMTRVQALESQQSQMQLNGASNNDLVSIQTQIQLVQRRLEESKTREASLIAEDKGKQAGTGMNLVSQLLLIFGGGSVGGGLLSGILQKITPSRSAGVVQKLEVKLERALAIVEGLQRGLVAPVPAPYPGPGDTVPPAGQPPA